VSLLDIVKGVFYSMIKRVLEMDALTEKVVMTGDVQCPQKAASSFHDDYRPSFGFSWRSVVMDFGIQFISFQDLLEKLMAQTVQKQHVFDTRQAAFPLFDTVFGYAEGTTSGVDA